MNATVTNDQLRGWRRNVLVALWAVAAASYAYIAAGGITADLAEIGQAFVLAMGTLILVRRPDHRIGWILAISGPAWMLIVTADIAAERLVEGGSVTTVGWLALPASVSTLPFLWLMNVALIVLFPGGSPSTRRGAILLRASAWFTGAGMVIAVFSEAIPMPPTGMSYPHPFLDDPLSFETAYGPMSIGVFGMGFVAAGMLIARARHADPVERRQIVVVAAGYVVAQVVWLGGGAVLPTAGDRGAFLVIDLVANSILAGSIAVAVIRYRLFELGRLLRRSLVYAGLAVVIATVYVAVVVFVGRYYGDDVDVALSIAATVAVALVFQPARRALERGAGRLVYGARAEPQEVLARFAHRAAELPDDELLDRIPELVTQGTSARSAALWIRTSDGFRTQAVWPMDTPSRTMPSTDHFAVPGADRSLPVFDEGELLGGVSIEKEPGEEVTPSEDALLADLAGTMGVALRNVRLASDLRLQLDALVESRDRLRTAADDARQDLEWRLDSGPQQRLVALKVKLGPVRAHAEQIGATEVADLLHRLEDETDDAIQSVRRFAAGVVPPELVSDGLAAAIRAHGDRSPFALEVHDRSRTAAVERDAQVAVYFTVLEALQNVAKHAGATSVDVTLRSTEEGLAFEIADDGAGFDTTAGDGGAGLSGMRDRVAAMGGRLAVHSSPDDGTRVVGHVPLAPPADTRTQVDSSTSMVNDDLGMKDTAPAAAAGASKSPDS